MVSYPSVSGTSAVPSSRRPTRVSKKEKKRRERRGPGAASPQPKRTPRTSLTQRRKDAKNPDRCRSGFSASLRLCVRPLFFSCLSRVWWTVHARLVSLGSSRRLIGGSLFCLTVLLAGCMNPGANWPMSGARRPIELPAPLGAQEHVGVARGAAPHNSNESTANNGDRPDPQSPEIESAEVDELPGPVFPGSVPARPDIDTVPKIEPLDVSPGEPLELTVAAPSRRPVGGDATYRVTLRNASDQPLEGLVVHCRFDDGLFLAGIEDRDVRQRLERLAPGQTKEMAVTLTGSAPGSHLCSFVVTRSRGDQEVELLSRQVAVDFVTRTIEIDVVGPVQRTEGSRAEFNITLMNRSTRTISDVQATIAFDKALAPKEASAEAVQNPGNLVWRLGTLEPSDSVQLQVEFECRSRAHRACVSVEVRGANLTPEQDETCLEIVPVPGTLDLQIADRGDPYDVGKTGTYELTVQNIGLQLARRVVLEAVIPENLKFLSAIVRAGEQEIRLKSTVQGAKIVFDPMTELEPNGRLVYIIEVEAIRPGTGELRASLSSSLSGTPVTSSEPTVVTEP